MRPITRAERRQHYRAALYLLFVGGVALAIGRPGSTWLELRWWESGSSTLIGALLIIMGSMGLVAVALAPRHPTEEWKREQAKIDEEGGK